MIANKSLDVILCEIEALAINIKLLDASHQSKALASLEETINIIKFGSFKNEDVNEVESSAKDVIEKEAETAVNEANLSPKVIIEYKEAFSNHDSSSEVSVEEDEEDDEDEEVVSDSEDWLTNTDTFQPDVHTPIKNNPPKTISSKGPKIVNQPLNQSPFRCLVEDCDKVYNLKNSFKIHMITHSDRYKCKKKCKLGFAARSKLDNHKCDAILKTRTRPNFKKKESQEEDFFKCSVLDCSKIFISKETLMAHQKTCDFDVVNSMKMKFTEEVFFHCKDCSQRFKYKQTFKRHTDKNHTNSK